MTAKRPEPASKAEVAELARILAERQHWDGMLVDDFDRICTYLRRMADSLGLSEWMLELRHVSLEPGDDALAHVDINDGQHFATITLAFDFMSRTLRQRRHCLIHELMHCHHADLGNMLRLTLPKLLGQPAYDAVWEPTRQHLELMTDQLTYVIARLIDDAEDLPLLCTGGEMDAAEQRYADELAGRGKAD